MKKNIKSDNIKISKIPKEDIYRSYNIEKDKIKKNIKIDKDKNNKNNNQVKKVKKNNEEFKEIRIKVKDENDFVKDEKKKYKERTKEYVKKEMKTFDDIYPNYSSKKEVKVTKKKISNKKCRKIIRYCLMIIVILTFVILILSLYKIYIWNKENNELKSMMNLLKENTLITSVEDPSKDTLINAPTDEEDPYWDYIKTPFMNVDFSNLLFTNKDTVAWIYLRNTNINYPVLQTINNDYYLNHSFDKSYNDAGWVFLDYRNDFNTSLNNIIYGHSRYDGSVFGTLRNVLEESFLKDKNNHIIKISTPTANTLWQIYSVYTIKEETYYIKTDFASDEYKTWQNDMLKRSIYNFNTTLLDNDRTLTLSSCYNNEDVRVVVHAKLIKELKRD